MATHCSRCKSANIRKSKARNAFEYFIRLFGFRRHRCRDCGKRFFRFL